MEQRQSGFVGLHRTPQLHRRRFPKPAFIRLGIQWKVCVEAFAWARWLPYRQVQAGSVTWFSPELQMSNCPEHTMEPHSALLKPRLANTAAPRQQPTCTDSRLDELRMDLHIHGRSDCQYVQMFKLYLHPGKACAMDVRATSV